MTFWCSINKVEFIAIWPVSLIRFQNRINGIFFHIQVRFRCSQKTKRMSSKVQNGRNSILCWEKISLDHSTGPEILSLYLPFTAAILHWRADLQSPRSAMLSNAQHYSAPSNQKMKIRDRFLKGFITWLNLGRINEYKVSYLVYSLY